MTVKSTTNLGVLLRSYEALHNWQALAMLAGSFILAGLCVIGGAAAGASSGSALLIGLTVVLGLLIAVVGMNASGLMLVNQAYEQPVRGFGPAFFGGMQSALAVLGAMLLLALGFGALFFAVFLLSLLGRIPLLGGFFGFLLAGPSVLAVALGYAVLALGSPLVIAAIWHGEGLVASLGRAAQIVLTKPLGVLMHFLVLGLIVFPAAMFIFCMVFGSSLAVGALYAVGSANAGGDASGIAGMGPLGMLMQSVDLHALGGASVSILLVMFLAWAVVSLIYVLGLIFVYRSVNEGVGLEASEFLGTSLTQLKNKLEACRPRPAAPAPEAPEAPAAPACPGCGAAIGAEDVFCGRCGHKLR